MRFSGPVQPRRGGEEERDDVNHHAAVEREELVEEGLLLALLDLGVELAGEEGAVVGEGAVEVGGLALRVGGGEGGVGVDGGGHLARLQAGHQAIADVLPVGLLLARLGGRHDEQRSVAGEGLIHLDFLAELFEQLTVVRATGALGVHGGDGGGQLLFHARDLGGEVAAVLGLEAALEAEVGGQSVVQAHERALVGRAQLLLDLADLQRLALHHVEVGSEVVEAVVAQAGTLDAFALELQFAQQFGVVDEEDGARVGELGIAENFEEPLGGLELRGALAELIPLALGERALQRFPFAPRAVRAVAFERNVGVAADDDEAVAGDRVEGLDAAVDEDGQLGPLADLEGVGLVGARLERVGGLEGEEGDKEPGPILFHTREGFAAKGRRERRGERGKRSTFNVQR